jgi:hypothetical protein
MAGGERALRPCQASGAPDGRSRAFGAGRPMDLPADHPMHGRAPDDWKFEPDLASAARFTPSGVLTAAEQERLRRELRYFREHGCIMIPDALVGGQLRRARRAYDRRLAAARAEWRAGDAAVRAERDGVPTPGHVFAPEFPAARVLEQEDELLALIEAPRLLPLLSQCVGEDLQCEAAFLRNNPGGGDPGATFSGAWHRDTANHHNNATGHSLALKVFYYLYDVAPNGGGVARPRSCPGRTPATSIRARCRTRSRPTCPAM